MADKEEERQILRLYRSYFSSTGPKNTIENLKKKASAGLSSLIAQYAITLSLFGTIRPEDLIFNEPPAVTEPVREEEVTKTYLDESILLKNYPKRDLINLIEKKPDAFPGFYERIPLNKFSNINSDIILENPVNQRNEELIPFIPDTGIEIKVRLPIDNLDDVLIRFRNTLNLERRFAILDSIPESTLEGIDQSSLTSVLETAYVAQLNRLYMEILPAIKHIEKMSLTVYHNVIGMFGQMKVKQEKIVPGGMEHMGKTDMFTIFSMDQFLAITYMQKFMEKQGSEGTGRLMRGNYALSTLFADKKSRKLILESLEIRERRKNAETLGKLDKGEEVIYDAFVVGLSTHASNFATTLRYLRPDLNIGGVDTFDQPGYLWSIRRHLYMNQTNNPASAKGGNLPRQGGDLFPLGLSGAAMLLPYITNGRWPQGNDAGACIRWNLNASMDDMIFRHEVTKVEKDAERGLYKITLKSKEGIERNVYSRSVINTGGVKERNPFRRTDGTYIDIQSYKIWEEETKKAKEGKSSLVFTYNQFSERIYSAEGIREFMTSGPGGRQKEFAIAGAGDGGKTIVEVLLGLATPETYDHMTIQESGAWPKMIWYDQKASTSEEYSEEERGRYARNCAGYTSGRIKNDKRKIGAIRRTDDGRKLKVYSLNEDGSVDYNFKIVDSLISGAGFDEIADTEIYGSLAGKGRENVIDSDYRTVAAKLSGEQVFFIGPYSRTSVKDAGEDVLKVFEELGINENQVADWWRGYQTQRFAVNFAQNAQASYLRELPAENKGIMSRIYENLFKRVPIQLAV